MHVCSSGRGGSARAHRPGRGAGSGRVGLAVCLDRWNTSLKLKKRNASGPVYETLVRVGPHVSPQNSLPAPLPSLNAPMGPALVRHHTKRLARSALSLTGARAQQYNRQQPQLPPVVLRARSNLPTLLRVRNTSPPPPLSVLCPFQFSFPGVIVVFVVVTSLSSVTQACAFFYLLFQL